MSSEQNRPEDSQRPAGHQGAGGTGGGQPIETPPHQRNAEKQNFDGEHHRDETTRNPGLDPEPQETPGLEDGGSVKPGDTPPDSNSATASPSQVAPEKPPKSKAVMTTVIIAIIVLLLLIFVGYIAGLLD